MPQNKVSAKLFNSWLDRIKVANVYREKFFKREAKKYVDYMRNKFPTDWWGRLDFDKIAVNDFQVNVRAQVPSLLFQNPTISAIPDMTSMDLKTDDPAALEKATKAAETKVKKLAYIGNMKWKELGVKKIFKQTIRDSLVQFMGIIRTDWITQNVSNPNYDPSKPSTDDNLEFFVKKDDLLVERIPPKRFGIDPDCPNPTELADAQYITIDYYKPLYEIRANKDFKNSDKITGKYQINNKFSDSLSADNEMIKKAKITLLYNQDDRTIAIISEELDEPLAVYEWADYWETYPVNLLAYTEDMEDDEEPCFYPIPDFRLYEAQIQEKNQLRTRYATFVRRFASIIGYDNVKVDKDQLNNVINSPDGGNVGFDAKGAPIDSLFKPLLAGVNFGQDKLNLMNIIEGDIERLSLVPGFKKGELPEEDRTATEFSKVAENIDTQMEERKDIVRDFLVDVASDCLRHIQNNLTDTGQVPIEDETGKTVLLPYSKEDIQGEFVVEMDVISLGRRNVQNEVDIATKKYQLFSEQPVINQRWNAEEYLKKVDSKADRVKAIMPEPQPPPKDPPKVNVSIRAEASAEQLAQLVPGLKPPPLPGAGGVPGEGAAPIPGTPVPGMEDVPPPEGVTAT